MPYEASSIVFKYWPPHEDTNSTLTDIAKRIFQGNVAMRVTQPGGQLWNQAMQVTSPDDQILNQFATN